MAQSPCGIFGFICLPTTSTQIRNEDHESFPSQDLMDLKSDPSCLRVRQCRV